MVDLRGGFAFSVAAHALILALLIFGLPYFHRKHEDLPPMISVELVTVADKTTTNKVSPENKVKQKVEEPTPAPPTPPPPDSQPAPEPVQEMQPVPELKAETVADAKPLDATIPELKIPEPVEKKVSPPPPPKPPEVKKEPPKPATPSFDAILKNLTKQKVQEPTDQPPVPNVKTPPKRASGAQVALSDKLTASQLDALAQQLRRCWSIPAGVKDAQEMVVDIDVTVNPDRTLASAQIDDAGRAASDPAFRAAAMAAMRALRMPECTPLELPPDKYNEWQSMTLHFDPKEMLGQ